MTVWTIASIRAANAAAAGHFFDPASMRFFRSRIGTAVYQGPGGVYFTTSEQFDHASPRRFTVRQFDPANGLIGSVGDFNALSAGTARRLAAKLAAGELGAVVGLSAGATFARETVPTAALPSA